MLVCFFLLIKNPAYFCLSQFFTRCNLSTLVFHLLIFFLQLFFCFLFPFNAILNEILTIHSFFRRESSQCIPWMVHKFSLHWTQKKQNKTKHWFQKIIETPYSVSVRKKWLKKTSSLFHTHFSLSWQLIYRVEHTKSAFNNT